MRDEYFKPINGYEGLYSISNYGRVYSHRLGRVLADRFSYGGYLDVALSKEGKKWRISRHRLVAFHFVSGYFKGAVVNHIDENVINNHYSNLEWVTQKQNIQHSYKRRNQEIIDKYCYKTGEQGT